ncbi:hypothetical protein CesoFtcFv8_022657 [Champsocephalus esox]|uniref:Allantoate amidinohydrolase n=1 Tax=Champsocephalus esox TaxID=159716 RepID=A0AAN8B7W4_9TELE|nr:hypothetical protein CesoFtcFv8_022657 [Champsocephalus esox]
MRANASHSSSLASRTQRPLSSGCTCDALWTEVSLLFFQVIFATDEWFAPAANLLKREQPVFVASAFTEFGKWMDGWETRRKRTPGHDWCIVALGVPGLIHGFDVDTSFFTGNHSPHVSIQAACLDTPPTFSLKGDRTGMAASDTQLTAVAKLHSEAWPELLKEAELQPGFSHCCNNYYSVSVTQRVTHLRLNMHPDGGISRLRVYGVGQRDWSDISPNQDVDLLALTNGGVCLGYSDAHFGHPRNMIGLGRGLNMADGWETARRLDRPKHLEEDEHGVLRVPGWEWAVFRLGHPGVIRSVELDTDHFKGNFPDSCSVEVCSLTAGEEAQSRSTGWHSGEWQILLPPKKLRADHHHVFHEASLCLRPPVSHVRLVIRPDGGVSRLRLIGRLAPTSPASTNPERPASKL